MSLKSNKLPLFLLFLSVFLTSSLAIRFPYRYEPSSEHWKCLQRCRSQRGGLLECIDECKGQGGSGEWASEDDAELIGVMINNQHHDRKHQFEQCRRQCQRQGQRGQSQQWQCQRRCQEEYQERESGRGGRYGERDDNVEDVSQGRDPYSRRDPQKRFKQCQQRCRRHGQRMECQRMCQEELQRQREGGQGGHYEDDDLEISENPHRDPRQRFKQCQQRCQKQGHRMECQRRCQEELRRQREERQGGRYEEDDLEVSENPHHDPQHHFKQCQQRCQRQGQRMECQRTCQEEYQRQEGRGGRYSEMSYHPTVLASFLKLTGLF